MSAFQPYHFVPLGDVVDFRCNRLIFRLSAVSRILSLLFRAVGSEFW